MSIDLHNSVHNKYLEDISIGIEVTESVTSYLNTKDLKRYIDLLDELLTESELIKELIVIATNINEQKCIDIKRLSKIYRINKQTSKRIVNITSQKC